MNKKLKQTSRLMFCISNNLTRTEALSFASTLSKNVQYFLLKVFENRNEAHISKREKFVIVRRARENEQIKGAYRRSLKLKDELIPI